MATTEEVLKELEIDNKTLTSLLKEGLPVLVRGGRGKAHVYDLEAVRAWYDEREIKKSLRKSIGNTEEDIEGFSLSRARREKAAADKLELEVAVMNRTYVPVADVQTIFTAVALNIKSKLEAVPQKAAVQCHGMSQFEMQDHLEKMMEEVLNELAGLKLSTESNP